MIQEATLVARIPALVGVNGIFKGQIYALKSGVRLTVGRSRSADFSMRRTQKFRQFILQQKPPEKAVLTVSGKHFQITMNSDKNIEVKNLSPNGTKLDGKPFDTAVLKDVATRAHEIRFGSNEVLSLEMREFDE